MNDIERQLEKDAILVLADREGAQCVVQRNRIENIRAQLPRRVSRDAAGTALGV